MIHLLKISVRRQAGGSSGASGDVSRIGATICGGRPAEFPPRRGCVRGKL